MTLRYGIVKTEEFEDFPHFSCSTRYWLVQYKVKKFLFYKYDSIVAYLSWDNEIDKVINWAKGKGYVINKIF